VKHTRECPLFSPVLAKRKLRNRASARSAGVEVEAGFRSTFLQRDESSPALLPTQNESSLTPTRLSGKRSRRKTCRYSPGDADTPSKAGRGRLLEGVSTTARESGAHSASWSAERHFAVVWEGRWKELWEYKLQHGHLGVRKEDRRLHSWVRQQRKEYKLRTRSDEPYMTPERIEKLEALGFRWDAPEESSGTRNAAPQDSGGDASLVPPDLRPGAKEDELKKSPAAGPAGDGEEEARSSAAVCDQCRSLGEECDGNDPCGCYISRFLDDHESLADYDHDIDADTLGCSYPTLGVGGISMNAQENEMEAIAESHSPPEACADAAALKAAPASEPLPSPPVFRLYERERERLLAFGEIRWRGNAGEKAPKKSKEAIDKSPSSPAAYVDTAAIKEIPASKSSLFPPNSARAAEPPPSEKGRTSRSEKRTERPHLSAFQIYFLREREHLLAPRGPPQGGNAGNITPSERERIIESWQALPLEEQKKFVVATAAAEDGTPQGEETGVGSLQREVGARQQAQSSQAELGPTARSSVTMTLPPGNEPASPPDGAATPLLRDKPETKELVCVTMNEKDGDKPLKSTSACDRCRSSNAKCDGMNPCGGCIARYLEKCPHLSDENIINEAVFDCSHGASEREMPSPKNNEQTKEGTKTRGRTLPIGSK